MSNGLINFLLSAIQEHFSANTGIVEAPILLLNQPNFQAVRSVSTPVIGGDASHSQRFSSGYEVDQLAILAGLK